MDFLRIPNIPNNKYSYIHFKSQIYQSWIKSLSQDNWTQGRHQNITEYFRLNYSTEIFDKQKKNHCNVIT